MFRFGVGVAGITTGVDGCCTGILFGPGLVLLLLLGVSLRNDDVEGAGLAVGVVNSSSVGERTSVPPLLSASSKSFSVTFFEPLRVILLATSAAEAAREEDEDESALSPPRNEDGGSRSFVLLPPPTVRPGAPAPCRDVPNSDASVFYVPGKTWRGDRRVFGDHKCERISLLYGRYVFGFLVRMLGRVTFPLCGPGPENPLKDTDALFDCYYNVRLRAGEFVALWIVRSLQGYGLLVHINPST